MCGVLCGCWYICISNRNPFCRLRNPAYRDINRRRIEAQLIQDLVKYLPIQHNEVEKISKGIVLRVALQYIKLHHLLDKTGAYVCILINYPTDI